MTRSNRTVVPALSRRQVLLGGLGLGALAGFAGHAPIAPMPVARASELAQDRYFLFVYFSGGWDLLMSLDPRDPGVFREDLKKVTRIQPAFGELPSSRRELVSTSVPGMNFGPYIGGLARHADKLAVIRGMSMDTLTHEVGRRRFLTGRAPAGLQAQGSSLATILAAQLGANDPIPQLSVRVESYNDHLPTHASAIRVSSVGDLVRALRVGPEGLPASTKARIDALIEAERSCFDSTSSLADAFQARLAAQDLVDLGLSERFDFAANTGEMAALRDLYHLDPTDPTSAPMQAASAVTALTSGISRCVSIEVARDLDSHGPEWSGAHGPRLEAGFDVVAALLDDLASRPYKDTADSWLDHVTVVGFSEFARTPLLNSSGGRDHHILNGCFLAGAGIRGGQVIGRSSDVGMSPTRTRLDTGASDPTGEIIKPEHLYRALLQSVGIDDDVGEYRAEALTALLA